MIESKCFPLIAYLVKFLGHIFYLDKLDYCISGVSMHCFPQVVAFYSSSTGSRNMAAQQRIFN